MTREEVYKEIKQRFGHVPTFFEEIPDSSLESFWKIFCQKSISRVR